MTLVILSSQMEGLTLTRRPALARVRSLDADTVARVMFALLCLGFAIGFFVYPTYPNYDSYYSLLWGREVLDLQMPTFEGFRVPTEHPLAIAAGAVLSLFGEVGDRLWIALILASFLWLVWGVYRLGADRVHAAGGRDRRRARADAVRLRVPGRPRLHRRPVHGDRDVGGGARGAAPAARDAGARCCWRRPACCAPRRGCWPACTGCGCSRARRGGSAPATPRWRRSAPLVWTLTDFIVTGDPLFSLLYTSGSAEDLGRQRTLTELPTAIPDFLPTS